MIKSIKYFAVFMLLAACGEVEVNQETLVKQIKDKSDVKSEIYVEKDSTEPFVYLYYIDGEVKNYDDCDSVTAITSTGKIVDTTVCREKYHLEKGQIYIINKDNKLFNQEPFDNIVVLSAYYNILESIDSTTQQAIFMGYSLSSELVPTSLKPNVTENAFNYDMIIMKNSIAYKAFKVERNGLWGLMNFDGEMLAPVEFSKIELNDSGKIKLYKGDKLEKEITIE